MKSLNIRDLLQGSNPQAINERKPKLAEVGSTNQTRDDDLQWRRIPNISLLEYFCQFLWYNEVI